MKILWSHTKHLDTELLGLQGRCIFKSIRNCKNFFSKRLCHFTCLPTMYENNSTVSPTFHINLIKLIFFVREYVCEGEVGEGQRKRERES